jgi:nucleoside-diphosphate-sugar epimerase
LKLFITGGSGFIGSNFINAAIKSKHNIVAIKRKDSLPRVKIDKDVVWLEGGLDGDYKKYLSECDVFVHIAAYGVVNGANDTNNCMLWNVIATYELCKQAHEAGITKFIIVGSCFEYGISGEEYDFIPVTAPLKPSTSYAASKAAASILLYGWAVESKLQMQILRVFHVYGEGEDGSRLWPSLYEAAINGRDFKMTKGEQIRDFINVKDVVQKMINNLQFNSIKVGLPIIQNIGSGHPQSVLDFCTYWWKVWDATGDLKPGALDYRDNEVMRFVPKIEKD